MQQSHKRIKRGVRVNNYLKEPKRRNKKKQFISKEMDQSYLATLGSLGMPMSSKKS